MSRNDWERRVKPSVKRGTDGTWQVDPAIDWSNPLAVMEAQEALARAGAAERRKARPKGFVAFLRRVWARL